jgi:hypothetical protein
MDLVQVRAVRTDPRLYRCCSRHAEIRGWLVGGRRMHSCAPPLVRCHVRLDTTCLRRILWLQIPLMKKIIAGGSAGAIASFICVPCDLMKV